MANIKIKTEIKEAHRKPAAPSLIPDPQWRTALPEKDLQRVLVKEAAAVAAATAMRDLKDNMKLHVQLYPSCQSRIDKIETILKRKKDFQVFIGFQGSSGAGKSTLINALIGSAQLLPSSAERACTAVPVEVAYNKSNNPDSKYILEVNYVTKDEWQAELAQLFAAIAAQEKGDESEDGETDTESKMIIEESLDKIKHVYKDIKTVEKLKSSKIDALLGHNLVRDILGSTKVLKMSNKANFTRALLEHIDSGDTSHSTTFWPLVKLVKVFVKAQMLEHGLVLVDLPGIGDVSLARSSVAERYQKQLSVTIIVADVRRGSSEKGAHDLLEKVAKRNMQLDGLYNAKSLCFVLSQIDRDFNVNEYLNSHPKLKEKHAEDEKAFRTANSKISALTKERAVATKANQENCRLAKKLSAEIKELKKRAKDSPYNTEYRRELAEKETRLLEYQNQILMEKKTIESFARRINSNQLAAFHARSRQRQGCIRNRNRLGINMIRKDYEDTLAQIGRKPTDSLEVFTVAAMLYLKYKHTPDRASGFPNREDTGVQELRDWLISTTFNDRESFAQAFLRDVESFLDSNAPWIHDRYGELKMPAEIRAVWEPQLLAKFKDLEENFSQLRRACSERIKELIHENLYSIIPAAERKAESAAKRQVEEFSRGTHWATHRSINRNEGYWKDSKKREHNWNDTFADALKEALNTQWNITFLERIPHEQDTFISAGKKLISEFADSTAQDNLCTDVAFALSALQDLVARNVDLLEAQSRQAWRRVTKSYRQAHRSMPPAVRTFNAPLYTECGSASGRGHFKINQGRHAEWMKTKGLQMHHATSQAAVEVLNEMLVNLPNHLEAAYRAPLKDIEEQISRFFDENTASGTRNSARRVISHSKINLQRAMLPILEELTKAWTSDNLVKQAVEEDDDEDAMLFDNDDLFDVTGRGSGGADGEGGSDYDDF